MYPLKDNIDIAILNNLDTATLAFLTEMRDRLELDTYKQVVDIINECTNKYKLERLLQNLMAKDEASNG